MADGEVENSALKEIHETLRLCNICFYSMGVSLIEAGSKDLRGRLKKYVAFLITFVFVIYMITGQYSYVVHQMKTNSNAIEGLIGSNLHVAGYGLMSFGKLLTIWYKQDKFRQLVKELADIWPADDKDANVVAIKQESLSALKHSQLVYSFWNVFGIVLYGMTPIAEYIYFIARGTPTELGYVFLLLYPFDKSKPIYHELTFFFETCGGALSVSVMLGTDLLFMTMTSHMSMLLRILQLKIRSLVSVEDIKKNIGNVDCYANITEAVKIHQRLIQYTNDLEDAFGAANLINVVLSSINICSCAFNVAFLDSWLSMSNKFFLGAALTQMGIVCWYADEIFRVSVSVSDAVYESGWYKADVRSRKALLLMLQRSQKPLYFTALKFSNITLVTYSSILTTSYSYFTLLYASFSQH